MAGSALTDVNGRGLLSARPSAGRAGRSYYATDTSTTYRDNGSSWDAQTSSGISDPTTTRGDMLFRNNSGAVTRLALGAANTVLHGSSTDPSYSAVVEGDLGLTDITTANASTTKHGFAPKYPNDATKYLDGTGAYSVPAGGGGTIAYPSLKPGSPTNDFSSALAGWTAVSGAGTFAIGNCLAQAIDGSHLWMGYNDAQRGFIYASASNVDQEWIVGGLTSTTRSGDFIGVALLDTSNDGVALIYHTSDNTCAIIAVAGGVYTASPSAIVLGGSPGSVIATPTKIWLRLTRVGNTWDAYYSYTGAAWDVHAGSTMSRTITVARKAIGTFSTDLGAQQIMADYVHTV